jgi:ribosome maturation factor RimP
MGTTEASVTAVRRALAPVVAGLGLELYDIELQGAGAARTLRVTVDRPGGVDLDSIAEVTRAVSPVLDDEPSLTGAYLLEVSSPGVERVLRTPAHYAGAHGTTVSIKVRTEAGTRRVHGVLLDSDDESCRVDVDGEHEEISFSDVTHARTVFEWGPQPRPGQRRRAGASSGTGKSKGATA